MNLCISFFAIIFSRITFFLNKLKERYLNSVLQSYGSKGRVTYLVDFRHPEHISIGSGTYINGGMLAASEHAKIVIGQDCMISYCVHMRTDMHRHDAIDVPMNQQGVNEADIVLGNDVWVGYGAQIMSGVTIGSHSIIGAGAVVTHNIPEYSVAVGVPARVIKDRRKTIENE